MRIASHLALEAPPRVAPGMSPAHRKAMMLEGVQKQLGNCRRCTLCDSRRPQSPPIFGGGSANAPIFLVGGNITWKEDETGRVLAGDQGALVSYALSRVGLDITRDVYATTVLKCLRPNTIKDGEKTRADPTPEQVKACARYLRLQISAVRPAIVVAHGRLAAEVLFGEQRPHPQYCGSWRTLGKDAVALATHSPAGLVFGERTALQGDFLSDYDGLAERLSLLGRMWRPDAACFQDGWTYRGVTTQ